MLNLPTKPGLSAETSGCLLNLKETNDKRFSNQKAFLCLTISKNNNLQIVNDVNKSIFDSFLALVTICLHVQINFTFFQLIVNS